jgi:hypothetical protein
MNLKGKYEFREFATLLFVSNTEQHMCPSCEASKDVPHVS